jgi:hypothetical protein
MEADQVQASMQQIHERLRGEMRWSQAFQEDGAKQGRIAAQNLQVGCKVWLDASNIPTIRPTLKFDLKRLGLFQVRK